MELYTSEYPNNWDFGEAYECSNDEIQRLTLPGETIAKYVRIKCINKNQGGNIVRVRHIEVKGIIKD